jgi:hypothetical protein
VRRFAIRSKRARNFCLLRLPEIVYTLLHVESAAMRVKICHEDVEALLTREARARLSLGHQLMLYLDPFAFFKDASTGNDWSRQHARSYNCAQRSILLTYIRRWALIAICSFLGIASAEALAAHVPLFIIPAAGFGISCSVAAAVAAWASAAYVLLGTQARRS